VLGRDAAYPNLAPPASRTRDTESNGGGTPSGTCGYDRRDGEVHMRMLMTVQMDTEATNHSIQDGTMAKQMESTLSQIHPEAAYFTAHEGYPHGIHRLRPGGHCTDPADRRAVVLGDERENRTIARHERSRSNRRD